MFEGIATFGMLFLGNLCTISTLEAGFSHPVLVIAICQGLVMSMAILASAPATGGHVCPVITWTEMLTGHITPVRGALYIMAQILGSIGAAVAAKAAAGDALAVKYSLGGCFLRSQVSATSGVVGVQAGRALLLEVVLTFFVLFIAYSVALDPPRLPRIGYTIAPFMVGGLVGLCIFAGGNLVSGYGGAGINSARCIGPAVALGGSMWTGQWVFWLGPALSGLAMAALYRTIPPTHVQVYKLRKAARARKLAMKSSKSMTPDDKLFADDKPFEAKATNCGLAHAIGSRIRNACSPNRSAGEKPMNDAV